MKVCSNCQTHYEDDSLKFCLQCGRVLPDLSTTLKTGGNGIIVAAILGGFVLLVLVVGGAGVYFFSQSDDQPQIETINSQNAQNNSNEKLEVQNDQPVEQLNGNQRSNPFPINSVNSGNHSNLSNGIAPRIIASASSVRKPEDGNFYFPNFAFDNNSATAWCEGVKGAGIGEWLQFNFDRAVTLRAIKIQPGYFKNDKVWTKNNRVAQISVKFSDDSTREFSLRDEKNEQTLEVGRTRTSWVKITVEDYHAGSADSDDTLISEVSFITEP